jgi:hypothetical protein
MIALAAFTLPRAAIVKRFGMQIRGKPAANLPSALLHLLFASSLKRP